MDDRQTGSIWTHYDGSILTGPLAGQDLQLEIQPMIHTTWAEWRSQHPDTLVLNWMPEYADRYRDLEPGRAGLSQQFQRTLLYEDYRLPENELVLGVNLGDKFRAYVLDDFEGLTAVNDTLDGLPVVIFLDPQNDFALAYLARVDGKPLEFATDGQRILDQTGSVWSVAGLALSGPLAGRELQYGTSFVTEWYGWAAYHPNTSNYGR